jgi:general nucleoside transport system ATP-binding protein
LLWLGAKVLILDEPTTGISALQKDKLFATLRLLVEQGMSVIFVSHKLDEVESLCGRVAVFQRGKLVGVAKPPYLTRDLVKMMFGKEVASGVRVQTCSEEVVLRLEDLSIEDYRLQTRNVTLDFCQGEVIGLAGMEGSGQRQFLRTLGGLMRPVGGKLIVKGKDMTGRPYSDFIKKGIAYVPAARLEEGLIPGLTLTEHTVLAENSKSFVIDRPRAEELTQQRIKEFSIRGRSENRIEELSGGNQQRALLALLRFPLTLLLIEHPTRGLDIESTIWIWGKLKERCKQGTNIIFISSDLDEILLYSDRVLVFFAGKVSAPLDAEQTTVGVLGQLIGGKGW